MAFQISPGVNVSEVDLTTVVPAVSSSVGAIAGPFQWGPVLKVKTIGSETELVNTFGKPDNNTANTFFTATNFLSYSNNLGVVRVIGASAWNANTGSTGILVENDDAYENVTVTDQEWIAKYPGSLGNSLMITTVDSSTYSTWSSAYKALFSAAPATSVYAANTSNNTASNDELHILVIDEDGKISGVPGQVLEKYAFVSKASDAKNESGESIYYQDVINRKSKYVWWGKHVSTTGSGTSWGSAVGATAFKNISGATAFQNSFVNGADDNVLTTGNITDGFDKFLPEIVSADLILSADGDQDVVGHLIDNIAEVKKDCVVFFSPLKADVVDNEGSEASDIVTYITTTVNPNSSYAVMDSNWKYQYDKYNDVYRWIPCNGDVAGLCARTDYTNDPWFSPAGYNRGIIKNVVKLAWNPTKAESDTIYAVGVNPIVTQAGVGNVLFGDKTTLARPSAFDRVNVRRLFIVLEKAIARASKFSLFEFNDEFTRNQFVGLVEPFLREVKGRRGITDYRVVCDETNNTPEVIDSNSFVGDIYVKPARSINYIQLNFVAVRSGVEFSEIVGKF